MKVYPIEIEGIDKTGKNLLVSYINHLSEYKYVIHDRGILSCMVYAEKYNRNYNYDLQYKPIIIYLTADKADWQIRCKVTRETESDYDVDKALFNKYKKILEDKGIIIIEYNTSIMTPYQIAKDFIERNLL